MDMGLGKRGGELRDRKGKGFEVRVAGEERGIGRKVMKREKDIGAPGGGAKGQTTPLC